MKLWYQEPREWAAFGAAEGSAEQQTECTEQSTGTAALEATAGIVAAST